MSTPHPKQSRRAHSALLLCLAASILFLALAPAAQAVPKYVHRVVAEGGTGAGQVKYLSDSGIAVNYASVADGTTDPLGGSTDGYVYLAEERNHRIQVFDSAGQFQFTFGRGVLDGSPVPQVCDKADSSCTSGTSGEQGGAFATPQGLAIDQDTGHVFVRERVNQRVQEFTAAGTFVRAFGWDVVQEGASGDTPTDQLETCFVAVECKAGSAGSGLGQLGSLLTGFGATVEVQQSSGDVFVSDPANKRIQRFSVPAVATNPVGFISSIGSAANFPLGNQPAYIAIDGDGILYASDTDNLGFGHVGDQIKRYDLEGDVAPGGVPGFLAPISISAETGSRADAKTRDLEVDPVSGNLLVARDRYLDTGASRISPVLEIADPGTANPADASLADTHVAGTNLQWTGIGFDPVTDTLYLAGLGEGAVAGNWLLVAEDNPLPVPATTFQPYSGVSADGATVNFTIDTTGLLPVSYTLQLANAASPTDFRTVASGQVAGSATPAAVSKTVSSLRPASAYLVRVITSKPFNNPGTTEVNPAHLLTAKSAPSVVDVRADHLQPTSARLAGQVNPNGTASSYHFEWGLGGFQNSIPIPDAAIGAGHHFVFVAEQLSGLAPGTTYQLRLVATSSDGSLPVIVSATETFTTPTADPAGRAFELVSPADKYGGQGVGYWPAGPGHIASAGVAAYAGERFMLTGLYGSVLSGDNAFGLNSEQMYSERVDSQQGWKATPVLSHPNYQPGLGQTMEMGGASEDLSSAYWSSPSTFAFFPEMTGPNPIPGQPRNWTAFDAGWLSEWHGLSGGPTRWELFGPRGLGPEEIVDQGRLPSAGIWRITISADGSAAYAMAKQATPPDGVKSPAHLLPTVHGLGGLDDPTLPSNGDLVSGRSIYYADLSAGLSDSFAGVGERVLANVCTGSAGVDRTRIPIATAGGDLEAAECLAGNGGRERLISDRGAAYWYEQSNQPPSKMVSEDGARVFFLSPDPRALDVPAKGCTGTGSSSLCAPQLYVRQINDDGSVVTRWVSRAEPGLFGTQDASLTGEVRFEGASRDGSVVYFRTAAPLTADDPNGGAQVPGGVKAGTPNPSSWDLYRFELAGGADPTGPGSSLARVSGGPGGAGDCNSPQPTLSSSGADTDTVSALRFLSDDGRRAYFTCSAPLLGVGAPGNGTVTAPGGTPATVDQTNLYLYDEADGSAEWRFVARLPRSVTSSSLDTCASTGVLRGTGFGGGSGVDSNIGWQGNSNCVRGNADGDFITLFTSGRITADDAGGAPIDDPPGKAVADIYAYDAAAGKLTRITAAQGGTGGSYLCAPSLGTGGGGATHLCNGDGGVAAQAGAGGLTHLGMAVEPLAPGDNIAFFNSASALVPEDEDAGYDVYEWRNGALGLITSGAPDSEDSFYKGNDRTGRDLYFVTRDALTWQDTDAVADVYTARVGGGIVEPPNPPACELLNGACKPPSPEAPAPNGASTAVISGEGNLVEKTAKPRKCPKGKVRKGKRCVSKAKKKRKGGAKGGRDAGKNGRAGR